MRWICFTVLDEIMKAISQVVKEEEKGNFIPINDNIYKIMEATLHPEEITQTRKYKIFSRYTCE